MLAFKSFFLKGDYFPPASKSYMFRALLFALIGKKALIINPLYNEDINNLLEIYEKMGAKLIKKKNSLEISFKKVKLLDYYNFKNSGTALRFITSYLSINKNKDSKIIISGDEQLQKRKILELLESLKDLGLNYKLLSKTRELPFEISSNITGGNCSIKGKSSQFLSSLLLNLPFCEKDSTVIVKELHERPYIDISLEFLDYLKIKYKNNNYKEINISSNNNIENFSFNIPSDYSSAAYIILASAIRGDVKIYGLKKNSKQADKFIIYFLEKIGFEIKYSKDYFKISGNIKNGGDFDLNSCPDLFPALSFFSANYKYNFKFYNLESARYKESDRISSVVNILKKIGIKINEFKDGIEFKGGFNSKVNTINAYNDHRIIMSSILLGMKKGYEINILNTDNLEISYPKFLHDIYKLR